MHSAARAALEVLGVKLGLSAVARRLTGRRPLILAYHNVMPDGVPTKGERSLHVSRSRFVEQIELLAATRRVVPLVEILDRGHTRGPADRPAAAITFDDAYAGALELALPELAERGLAATLFVPPGLLGNESFWWDAVADSESGLVAPDIRARALDEHEGRDDRIRAWAHRAGQPVHEVGVWERPGTPDQLDRAALLPRITFGSHTWSHPDLVRIDAADRTREIAESLAWLADRYPDRTIPWIAYPYGRCSREVADAARRSGCAGGLRIDGGLVGRGDARAIALPRLNVPAGLSVRGFELRAAGLFAR